MREPVDLKRNPNDVVLVVAAIIIVAYMYVCI